MADSQSILPFDAWADFFGSEFDRTAVFACDGVALRLRSCNGFSPVDPELRLSLKEETPFRWAVLAATPMLGAGEAPGGRAISDLLGLNVPRAFGVIPIVHQDELVALAYVDQEDEPLPVGKAGSLLQKCAELANAQIAPREMPALEALPDELSADAILCDDDIVEPIFTPQDVEAPDDWAELTTQAAETFSLSGHAGPAHPPALGISSLLSKFPDFGVWNRSEGKSDLFRPIERIARAVSEEPEEPCEDPTPWETGVALPAYAAPAEPDRLPEAEALSPARTPEIPQPSESIPNADIAIPPEHVAPLWVRSAMHGRIATIFSVVLITAALASLSLVLPTASSVRATEVRIQPGDTLHTIAKTMWDAEVIRSPLGFRVYAQMTGADRALKAGRYTIPANAWLWDVVTTLKQGQLHQRQVTIPEGLTLPEVAAKVEEAGLGSAAAVLAAANDPSLLAEFKIPAKRAEGYLMPETYTFAEGVSAKEVVRRMLTLFFSRLKTVPDAARLSPQQLHDAITLASIVQRETKTSREMPRIAGVFRNRLRRGIKLESCATVQYVLGETKPKLTLSDVRTPSPYNTYLNKGLPPGPIAHPGLDAVRAALHPEQNPYLFFFAREDGTGSHIFSQTYDQHMQRRRTMLASKSG